MATPPINGTSDDTGSGTIRVTAVLGTGGMATVWAGSQDYGDGWRRPCAVKMVRDDLQHDPDYRRRLRREAEIGLDATVGHPALLTTRGYASFAGARCVLVDLVDGPSLEAILRQGPLPANIVRLVAYELCGALEHLRSLHIAHRDISPANILIDTRGAVFLTDFGLAKRVAEDSPGIARGTFAYASPEMIRDQPVTCASDAYSLGAVLSEMLCGYPPRGADLETVIEHLGRLPRLPRATPKDLVRVIHGLSAKHPAHRLLPGAAKKLLRGPDANAANAANVADIRASLGDIARTVSRPDRAPLTTIPALQQTERSYPIELEPRLLRRVHLRRYASVAAIAALGALFGIVGTLSYVTPERVQLDNAPATTEQSDSRDVPDSPSRYPATLADTAYHRGPDELRQHSRQSNTAVGKNTTPAATAPEYVLSPASKSQNADSATARSQTTSAHNQSRDDHRPMLPRPPSTRADTGDHPQQRLHRDSTGSLQHTDYVNLPPEEFRTSKHHPSSPEHDKATPAQQVIEANELAMMTYLGEAHVGGADFIGLYLVQKHDNKAVFRFYVKGSCNPTHVSVRVGVQLVEVQKFTSRGGDGSFEIPMLHETPSVVQVVFGSDDKRFGMVPSFIL